MKLLNIFMLLAALTLAAGSAAAQASKVGFVNPQRVIMESRIGRVAQEDLSRFGEIKDRQIRDARAKAEEIQAQLSVGVLSVSEQASLEQSLRIAAREYDQLVSNSTQDLQNEERRLVKFIMRRADTILRRLAAEMGFTLILTDPEAIGYVDASVDITDRVIRELDAMM